MSLIALLMVLLVWPAPPVTAQSGLGTTITILRGEVAVVYSDGTAVQPAPSGTVVGPGDELRAVSPGGASVRLVDGVEVDMTQGTIIVVGGVVREGRRTNVLVSQIQGGTETFVAFLADPESSLNMVVGGVVIVVGWGTLAVSGPTDTGDGTVVGIACVVCLETDYIEDIDFDSLPLNGSARIPDDALPPDNSLIGRTPSDLEDAAHELLRLPLASDDPVMPVRGSRSRAYVGRVPKAAVPTISDADRLRSLLMNHLGITPVDIQRAAVSQQTREDIIKAKYGISAEVKPYSPTLGIGYTGPVPTEFNIQHPYYQALYGTGIYDPVSIDFERSVLESRLSMLEALNRRFTSLFAFGVEKRKRFGPSPLQALQRMTLSTASGQTLGATGWLPLNFSVATAFVQPKETPSNPLTMASSSATTMAQVLMGGGKPSLSNKPDNKKDPKKPSSVFDTGIGPVGTTLINLVCIRPSAIDLVCSVQVEDQHGRAAPTGQVQFSSPGGFFFAGSTCTLVATGPAQSECQIAFEPAGPTNTPVTAVYQPNTGFFRTSTFNGTVP